MLARLVFLVTLGLVAGRCFTADAAEPKHKALIVDGQNNHGVWPKTTVMMKKYLEETGLFTVDIARTRLTWNGSELAKYGLDDGKQYEEVKGPQTDPEFKPDFSKYGLVVSNYNGAAWPEATQQAFEKFVSAGGGYVVVHAANNAFPGWKEYDRMIGLGWRGAEYGDRVTVDESGKTVRTAKGQGPGAGHGPQHAFPVIIRDTEHPITKGLPAAWLHVQDELYHGQRGPAENMRVLATAFSAQDKGGTGSHEPMIWVIPHGKGRVVTTVLGHGDYSQECVGFIVTFQRAAEFAVTGTVTQVVPKDFPTEDKSSQRKFE